MSGFSLTAQAVMAIGAYPQQKPIATEIFSGEASTCHYAESGPAPATVPGAGKLG